MRQQIKTADYTDDSVTSEKLSEELRTVIENIGGAPTGVIEIGIDGGGTVPTTGVLLDFTVPCDLTITGWQMTGNVSGSIQLDLWKDTFANHPPTIADTVTASDKPKLAGTITASGSATGWTTDWNSGEIIRVNVDSAGTLTKANITLFYTRR